MNTLKLSSLVPGAVPAEGWKVRYRAKGSADAYTTAGPFMSHPISISASGAPGINYEGFIWCDCGTLESSEFAWATVCRCPEDWTPTVDDLQCQTIESIPATVTESDYCMVLNPNQAYGIYGTRIYKQTYVDSDLDLPFGTTGGNIDANLTTTLQWQNPAVSLFGPLNREGLWIDSDCNGTPNGLGIGGEFTLAFQYNNIGPARWAFIGMGADNYFTFKHNGVIKLTSPTTGDLQFRIWHVIPVYITAGLNNFNFGALDDGGGSIANIGAVIYDNPIADLIAATSDASLNILFKTSSLHNQHYDLATCPEDYDLDTSGGVGSYMCRKTEYGLCNAFPA